MAVSFRNRKACSCVVGYVAALEAKLGHGVYIFQASYSSGVAASAGTHNGGGALDIGTLTRAELKTARLLGGAAWNRTRAQGFDPHCHIIICGCPHLSDGAAFQVWEYRNGRNGLAKRRPDDGPRVKWVTWAGWKAAHPDPIIINGNQYPGLTHLSVSWVLTARTAGTFSRNVWQVQCWLAKVQLYREPCDGVWNPATQTGLDLFRQLLGWTGTDLTGAPGLDSLTRLAKKAGSSLPVKVK